MVSFKKVLLLLSASTFMADMLGFTGNRFCVYGTIVGTHESSDSGLSDSEDEIYYDALSSLYETPKDTKSETGVSTTTDKTETPKPDSLIVQSQKLEKPTISFQRRTVYVPKKKVTKVVKPFGSTFVETEVLGKRSGSYTVDKDLESPKKRKIEPIPEIELKSFSPLGSPSLQDIAPEDKPSPLSYESDSSLDRILSSDARSVPTYGSFGRHTVDELLSLSDEYLSSSDSDDDIFVNDYQPAGYDGTIYATPYDPKLSKSKVDKFKSGTKKRISEASKKVTGAISKTKDILKDKKEDKSKNKSTLSSKTIPKLSEDEKYGGTSVKLDSESSKSKIKSAKDSTKEALYFTSKKIHDAAHKTKKRTVSASRKVKAATEDLKSDIKDKATELNQKLRGVLPKTKIAIDRIQKSISESHFKPKKTFKKLFNGKFGKYES